MHPDRGGPCVDRWCLVASTVAPSLASVVQNPQVPKYPQLLVSSDLEPAVDARLEYSASVPRHRLASLGHIEVHSCFCRYVVEARAILASFCSSHAQFTHIRDLQSPTRYPRDSKLLFREELKTSQELGGALVSPRLDLKSFRPGATISILSVRSRSNFQFIRPSYVRQVPVTARARRIVPMLGVAIVVQHTVIGRKSY
ncbi:hypothetical protein CONLIGDRAFT_383385 [Coniochaeta ligniaria NRRL 30616]|uniref:Uncharacterized protein n=1 Tax=Coniochaeta ligniaria NRRL 30616 TaxID=1408157 RepID=A0A1J7IME2_9PEZI|nr:hypothetical protein CONLIGDRAFT_383385 [Coniochaeta ligniaria NRRL 30616]